MAHLTQIPGSTREQVCDIVIGFDFGTSSTKVVIRTPNQTNRTFAVPFSQFAHQSCIYLLPTLVWIREDGTFSLSESDGATQVRDIKYHMIRKDAPEHEDSWACGVAFLALALRQVRSWFIQTHGRAYQDQQLAWQVNIGLPSADYADQALCQKYMRMLKAGWVLSLMSQPPSYSSSHEAFDHVRSEPDEKTDVVGQSEEDEAELSIIPEVAAEVVGYARSHHRREGLHLLIDVGASTLDICGFILHEFDGDDCYRLLTADVQQLGGLMLFRSRIEAVLAAAKAHGEVLLESFDPVSTVPPVTERYIPTFEAMHQAVGEGNLTHSAECRRMTWKTIVSLKMKRDPNSPHWKTMLPVFLAGGASQMGAYKEAFKQVSKEVAKNYGFGGLKIMSIEKPQPLEGDIRDDEYHRLAVAWGLSYPSVDIGEVTRPEEIEDVVKTSRATRTTHFVSKDDM